RLQEPLEDEVLGVGDDRRLLGVGLAVDAEELLLEGAAVVEGEDVQLQVVAGPHGPQYSRGAPAGVQRSLEWIGDVLWRGSVRRLQALRLRGKPLHNRVSVLRPPSAPACAEDPARDGSQGEEGLC